MATEPINKVSLDAGGVVIVVHLPIRDEEVVACPICVDRQYRGKTKIESLGRHIKQHHDGSRITYSCWRCGFVAPSEKRYPRKVVQQHCGECVPSIQPTRTGRTDTNRRNNIRLELFPGGVVRDAATRRRNIRRGHTHELTPHLDPIRFTNQETLGQTSDSACEELTIPTRTTRGAQQSERNASTVVSPASLQIPSSLDLPPFSLPLAPGRTSTPRSMPHSSQASAAVLQSPAGALQRAPTSRSQQLRLVSELNTIALSEQLEAIMPRVATFLGRFSCSAPAASRDERENRVQATQRVPHGPPDRVQEARRIQRLYRRNRKTAVQKVLAGSDNVRCEIDKSTVENYFTQLAAHRDGVGDWPDVLKQDAPTSESTEQLCSPFKEWQVVNCLKGRASTSPGPDGVRYGDLRRADPGARVLTALFNAVWRTESIPSSWGHSNTILLHKKGDVGDIRNWRPISLGDTVPKLFAAILSGRIKRWAVANSRFSHAQKGFLHFEGCFEHNFVLSQIIQNAKAQSGELVVAWLDLASAFNSLPHSSIFRALEDHGAPAKVKNVLTSLYSGTTTSVRVSSGSTAPIHVQSGVRQGCPLSPDVFNLTLEVLLRNLINTGEGYTFEGRKFTTFFYADDGALVADSTEGMRNLLQAAESAARAIGIIFNADKCATLHLKGGGVEATEFAIQGVPMPPLSSADAYEHLGIPTGYQVRQTPVNTIRDLLEDSQKISDSLLAPWQKLDAVSTFLLPRLDFIMQGGNIEKEYLTEADRRIRRLAKCCLGLPQRASAEIICLPPSQGGGGILPLSDLYDLLTVAHSYRLLYAGDNAVSSLAASLLRRTVSERLRKDASNIDIARYLSGDMDMPRSSAKSSFWSKVRSATMRLKTKLRLRWYWCSERAVFGVVCCNSSGTVWPEQRNRVANYLRRMLVGHYAEVLLAKRDQGKVFEATKRTTVSNHFLRSGRNTRFCDWRFIHRARLNVLPLNAANRWQPDADRRCRRCGDTLESLPHVLNHCGVHAEARQLRHNNIQNRLVNAARCPGTVSVNGAVSGTRGTAAALRPDIVIRDETDRRITIIDVCVPFENRREALRLARRDKRNKYQPIAQQLTAQGYSVTVEAFMVGALGAWEERNDMVIAQLGISRRYAGMMRRFMVSDNIRWSRDIYVEHVSGVRQYRTEPASH